MHAQANSAFDMQPLIRWELIAVDDGSTDRSPEILDHFNGRLVRIRIPNSGISNARNTGMSIARGDYIAFLDQDDVWFKEISVRPLPASN